MSTAAAKLASGRLPRPSLLPEHVDSDWDEAAEQSVLGGALLIPGVMDQVSDILEPTDFFLPCHQRIFAAALSLRTDGSPVDPITVADRVAADPDVESQRDRDYIWSLSGLSVPAVNAPHHARIVKAMAIRRRGKDVASALLEGTMDIPTAQTALLELGREEHSEGLPTISAIDFCREVPETPDWVVEGYLARGAITELDAKIKTGKTHFATDLIRALLAGEEFLGRRTVPTPVLYLTEERRATFRAALGRVDLEDAPGLHLLLRQECRTAWADMGRAVVVKAKTLGVGLVVVDTLSDWSDLQADMENDAGAALEAMRPLQEMAAAGLAVLVLRHERKSGGEVGQAARGSSAFGGATDIVLSLKKDPSLGHENRRLLEAVGRLEGWAPRLVLEMTEGRYRSLGTSTQVEADRARDIILDLLPTTEAQAVDENSLLDSTPEQLSRSTLKRALKELSAQGAVQKGKGAGTASSRAFGYWKTKENQP